MDNDGAQQWGVGADGWSLCRQGSAQGDGVEAARENFDSFADDVVDVGGIEFGGGEANELREFIDQGSDCTDFAFDEARAFFDQASEFGVARSGIARCVALFQVAGEALSGKLDGSEGIFDFVSDAASDFLPGSGFLRTEEFGEAIQNETKTGIGAPRAERAAGYVSVLKAHSRPY